MPVINVAVEGATDLAVVSKILEDAGFQVGVAYGQKGKAHLDTCLRGFNNSANYRPWVVVRDLDRDASCPPALVRTLIAHPAEWMRLRVATRAIESWLIADAEMLAHYLGIPQARIPTIPDDLDDPKGSLIKLARMSRRRALLDDLVPVSGHSGRVGRGYTFRVTEFASLHWRPQVAREHSESLKRCMARVRELMTFSATRRD